MTFNVVGPFTADQPFEGEGGIPLVDTMHSPLRSVLRVLRRHLWFVVIVSAAITAAGTAITLSLPKGYTARATVAVRDAVNDPLASADAPAPRLGDGAAETVAVELRSSDLLAKLASEIGFGAEPLPPPLPIQLLCRYIDLGGMCVQRPPPSLAVRAEELATHLAIEPVGKSRAIALTFTAPSAVMAARGVNLLMDLGQERERERNISSLAQTSGWLDDRASELRAKWLAAEQRVSDFRAQNGLTQTAADGRAGSLTTQQLVSAATDLSDAQAKLAAASARATAMQDSVRGDKRALVRLSEQPVIAAAAIALNTLTSQRAQLSAQFGPSYPQAVALNRQVAQAESNLNAQISVVMQSIRSDLAEKQAQVDLLTSNLNRLRGIANVQSSQYGDLATLQGEADVVKQGYQNFLSHAQSYTDRSQVQQASLTIVSHATVPEKPSTPAVSRFILASGLFGLVVSCGCVFAFEHLKHGFGEISRVGAALSLPLLATVPVVARRRWFGRRRAVGRYVAERPMSRAAEAARAIATSVTLAGARTDAARVVAITSATAREGKSVLCMWLASVMAASGRKVLLIDGDFRSGMVSRVLQNQQLPVAAGFAELLQGDATLQDVVQYDRGTNIHFIASRHLALATGALDVQRLRAVLDTIKAQFSLVILDTPPLMAISDSLIYCSVADQTVFVCRWQQTGRNAIHASVNRLREARAQITGVVVSMVSQRQEALYNDTISRRDQVLLRQYFRG